MLKELMKIAAAALGAAATQIGNLFLTGQHITAHVLVSILVGTVLVRVAMWVVATFGPQPVA